MLRRLLTLFAVGCAAMALTAASISVRGRFATDYLKTFHWNPATRRYHEWYVSAQGGLVLVHAEGTTLDAATDPQAAASRAGATGTHRAYRVTAPSRPSYGSYVYYDHNAAAHAGVVNFGGMAETWTLEFQPAFVATVAVLPPVLLVAIRLWRSRRRRQSIAAGHCAHCGYDLRASPDRCPECGFDVAQAGLLPIAT